MRGVHARPDERDFDIAARPPEGFAVGALVRVNVRFQGDLIVAGQTAQAGRKRAGIRPAAVFDAQRTVKFVGHLPVADGGHVYGQQFGEVVGKPGRCAVPDFFVIGKVQRRRLRDCQIFIVQGFDDGENAGDTGFVVEMARADKSVDLLHARVKRHKIADFDS